MEEWALKYADNSVDGVSELGVLWLIQFWPVFFKEFQRSLCIWNVQIKKTLTTCGQKKTNKKNTHNTKWFMDCSTGSQSWFWSILSYNMLAFSLLYQIYFNSRRIKCVGSRGNSYICRSGVYSRTREENLWNGVKEITQQQPPLLWDLFIVWIHKVFKTFL